MTKPTCQPIAKTQIKPFTFHRPKPAVDAGFPKAPPKGIENTKTAPRKRGPKTLVQQAASALRTDEERKADKLAKATAFTRQAAIFRSSQPHRNQSPALLAP